MNDIKQKIKDKNKEINQLLETRTMSVSKLIEYMHKEFDRDGVAKKCFEKGFDDPKSKYYQMDVNAILESWEAKATESKKYGSMMDNYIGTFLTDPDYLETWKLDNNYEYDERLHAHCDAFDDFYNLLKTSGDYEFITREKTVYYKVGDFYIKGRFDALFKNKKTGKYCVIDWKSSGSIDKTKTPWTKNLLGPCGKLPALNYYTYTLQLYFYKKALVQMGYLPEGTNIDDVTVMIVNLPDHIIEETGKRFATHQAAFTYDDELMNRLFSFAIQKHQIMNS